MTTLLPTQPPRRAAAPTSSGQSTCRYELKLHQAQAEVLDRELALRKELFGVIERVMAAFERVFPLFERRNPVFAGYPQQLAQVRAQLTEMKRREGVAELPPELPLGNVVGQEAELLRQNARRAVANSEYFRLLPLLQVLVNNLHGLLLKVSGSDRALAGPLGTAAKEIETLWNKVAPLGGALAVRRIAIAETTPAPQQVRQAELFWNEVLQKNGPNVYLDGLRPHESKPGPLRIAFISIGGLGDALLQTPCVAEIRRRFAPCEIVFIHSRGVVHPLFARNRTVEATIYAEDRLIVPLPEILKTLSIFDVVFESRFLIWGERCAHSRLTSEADVSWLRNTQRHIATFTPYLERFPQYSNLFARLVQPKMLLDVHGMSTGLPVAVDSPLLICPAEPDADYPASLGLAEGGYVTVHDGFDEGFGKMMGISRCTKQLPTEKWGQIIDGVRRLGLQVVQVGGANEPLLPGVSLDLRGKTSLSQLCFILKSSVVHIDTEGGIVHMARAVQKRAIVFFGPTSVTFWGYPWNINRTSEEYVDSWWINFDWMARSPIAQKRSAMEAFDVSAVPGLVAQERAAAGEVAFRMELIEMAGGEDPHATASAVQAMWDRAISDRRDSSVRVAVVGQLPFGLSDSALVDRNAETFDINEAPAEADRCAPTARRGSLYNLPANSGQYDVVLCPAVLVQARHKPAALKELLRLVKPGGTFFGLCDHDAVAASVPPALMTEPRRLVLDDVDQATLIDEVCGKLSAHGRPIICGRCAFLITRLR